MGNGRLLESVVEMASRVWHSSKIGHSNQRQTTPNIGKTSAKTQRVNKDLFNTNANSYC